MKKNRYEFTIEELNCYTITLEIEPIERRNTEEGEAIWDKNGYNCDACHDYANQPFEMDWQGHD